MQKSESENSKPTIKDVARLAGVGIGTVSRVLNGSGPVGDETKRRVLSAIEQLKFTPHVLARGLRTNRLPSVGMIVSDISNPLFAQIVQSANGILVNSGYQLQLGITNGNPKQESHLFESFVRQGVSGIIASLIRDTSRSVVQTIKQLPIPIVLLDRKLPQFETNVITNDHATGSEQAIDYLYELGHRKIAVILGAGHTLPGRIRKHSILSRLDSYKILPPQHYLYEIALEPKEAYRAMTALLSSSQRPTAVILGSNQIFAGALRALRELGLEYPADVSLVSYDDVNLTQLLDPPITIVNRDLADFGVEAAKLVIQHIEDQPKGTTSRVLATWLEIRKSCKKIETI